MGLALEAVVKRFGKHAAVDGVTVDIADREFFAIVGASGCGKSTLLRLIAGLDPVTEGGIRIAGEPVSGPDLHKAPEDRNVGFVFQSYALWPHLDVRGNVAFPAEMAGLSRRVAAERADAHLATVALGAFADRKPADLSGGQRQRVALARCLAQNAGTILMDEPLANLDPHLRRTMEEELLTFHRQAGATTIYITHDQREAMAVADRMAVMARGRFLQVGTPTEIYDCPANAEVARFIGAGTLLPLDWVEGAPTIAGKGVPLRGGPPGGDPTLALIRPQDLTLGDPGSGDWDGEVESALYRGGVWEARIRVDRLPTPLEVASRTRLRPGDRLGVRVDDGWCLPA
ncbi:MAG: ABC transporter ATP-binding protein [Pseudomonadota bacterium]